MQTVSEIESAMAELEAKKAALVNEKRQSMIDYIATIIGGVSGDDLIEIYQSAAAKHGISLDIKVVKPAKQKAPAKYRNPFNPEQEWSGRGKSPAWLDPTRKLEFLINNAAINTPGLE